MAAVRANLELGLIDLRRAGAIERACQDVKEGRLDDQFVVDVLQGGAGTSTNMNANEVIANRALELLGRPPGRYDEVHPLDHVNRSQSTNDVYPTAVRLGRSPRSMASPDPCTCSPRSARPSPISSGRAEGGTHPAAGRGPHDRRPGVRRVGRHPSRGASAHRGRTRAAARDQSRGHRDRHRHHRGAGVPRDRVPPPGRDHWPADCRRGRPGRGNLRHRSVRAAFRRAQAHRREAVEDVQRPPVALLGPAGRPR